ncbi:class II aldolase and Adducin N-terminal domain-containing protein [Xylariaceae sp. FL0804]|nr:class II aldolase and Adducin N-terminal domain-containing protein [Xylariaceae sp. FL0804]
MATGDDDFALNCFFRDLISANHILHQHSVCDAYGHVSARHPSDPTRLFVMAAARAPALVASPAHLVAYRIADASAAFVIIPGNDNDDDDDHTKPKKPPPPPPRGYIERHIHAALYRRHGGGVGSVVHAHAPDVLPYAVAGVPLRPLFHLAGFLGRRRRRGDGGHYDDVPVWDIEDAYREGGGGSGGEKHDLLVRSARLGDHLARAFDYSRGRGGEEEDEAEAAKRHSTGTTPDAKVVLMRKHGFTTWGQDVRSAVFRAVYTVENARLQTSALLLRNAFGSLYGEDGNRGAGVRAGTGTGTQPWTRGGNNAALRGALEPLTERQAADAEASNDGTIDRPWDLWVAEVEANGLYTNDMSYRPPRF